MKTILFTTFMFLSLSLITSCSDDEPTKEKAKTKTELLTAKTWTLTTADFVSSDGTVTAAPASFMGNCSKDNTYSFSVAGTFLFKAGADNCNSTEANSEGTWSWEETETILAISSKDYMLVEVTETSLKIKISEIYDLDQSGFLSDWEKIDVVYTYTGS